ncbi:MAG: SH3 domain-containing protein [Caldilineaceae bacterium]
MSDQDVTNKWRLEETGETQDRWKLQDAEQHALQRWQLQDDRQSETPWQPVDYARDRAGASNWLLPSLVVIAFVAVVAYIAWIGLTRAGLLTATPPAGSAAEANKTPATPANASGSSASTGAPTATLTTAPTQPPVETPTAAPTDTPAPTPTVAQVEQQFVSVNDPAGVNARSAPDTTAAVVKLLEPGQRVLVVDQNNDWLQVALAKDSLAWVKADVVERSSQLVSLDEANQRRAELGLSPLASQPAQSPAASTGVTNTASSTNTTGVATSPATTTLSVRTSLTATISSTGGLNARVSPSTTAATVKLLADGARYKATGRSADDQWLQIVLEDGTTAWVFAEFVRVSGNVAELPAPSASTGASGVITRSTTLSSTPPISGFAGVTATVNTTPVPTRPGNATGNGATVTVSNLAGANARATPDRTAKVLTLFPFEAVLPAIGRSADNQWVEVRQEDGQTAWMLTSAVKLSADIATLPVANP